MPLNPVQLGGMMCVLAARFRQHYFNPENGLGK
jgi:hypothetical protein